MSIDPTIESSRAPINALPFGKLEILQDAVFVFDFDGVISSRLEDEIYKLPPTADEIELLFKAGSTLGVRCDDMEQRYQRHLIYQAAAWKLRLPVEPGVGLAKAKLASDISHLFVLSARSGWHAVERLRAFLRERDVQPIEVFNVGRVKKDRQIELLCREYPAKAVHFIEDSAAHLTNVATLPFQNLRLVLLEEQLDPQPSAAYLREHFQEVVRKAIE